MITALNILGLFFTIIGCLILAFILVCWDSKISVKEGLKIVFEKDP